MPNTIICAHRGLDDSAPENTLVAFEAALSRGMAIEFDVKITSDGHIVVMHDRRVDRTTNGTGKVSQMTFEEIRSLDAGGWFGAEFANLRVPTLDEVLELTRSHAQVAPAIALDVKDVSPTTIDLICKSIEKYELFENIVGIGAIIGSEDTRRQFSDRAKSFNCSAAAQTPEELDSAIKDSFSSWVYARYVPTNEDLQQVHGSGKRLFVSGNEVSTYVERAYDAYKVSPDVVLTWHPTKLTELINS